MAYTLTSVQLARLRRKIGDEAETAFGDAELHDLYDEAAGDWNLTIALVAEELLFNAAKRADYRSNESEEKRSQIFANLEKLANRYRGLASTASNQVRIVGMKARPPKNKQKPGGNSNKPIGWDW